MHIRRAMLFAAGLGTRLLPLTKEKPKPLVSVGGRALLDYNLHSFIEHGCERVVINTHHLAAQIEEHLAHVKGETELCLLHEPQLLETGGGIVNALPLLGGAPFFSANSDAFWLDERQPALSRLESMFDEAEMDALLLLVPREKAVGYSGKGDFGLTSGGLLTRQPADYVFTGLQVLHPRLFALRKALPFSLRDVYRDAQNQDGILSRMYGVVHDGAWAHVGSLAERAEVERFLAERSLLKTSLAD